MKKLQTSTKPDRTALARSLIATHGVAGATALVRKMFHAPETPPPQRPAGGFYSALFATTKAATIAKAALPVPSAMPRQTGTLPEPVPNALIAERQNLAQWFGEPSALNSVLHRKTADAHAALIAQIKAIHNAEQGRHPSTGPEALR